MPDQNDQDQIKTLLGEIADFSAVSAAIQSAEKAAAHPISVIIVDDDAVAVLEMSECISETGVRCMTATSAAQALDRIDAEAGIDIVITDLKMPGMDGLEFARRLRTVSGSDTEIIMVSGQGDMNDVQQAMHENVREFLTKPLDCEALADSVTRLGDAILQSRAEAAKPTITNWDRPR